MAAYGLTLRRKSGIFFCRRRGQKDAITSDGRVMNSSLYSLDRGTHLKIVMVAAMMAVVVLIVGESAQPGRSAPAAAAAAAIAIPGASSTWSVAKPEILARIPG